MATIGTGMNDTRMNDTEMYDTEMYEEVRRYNGTGTGCVTLIVPGDSDI